MQELWWKAKTTPDKFLLMPLCPQHPEQWLHLKHAHRDDVEHHLRGKCSNAPSRWSVSCHMNLFPVLDECVINTTRHGSFVARVGSLDRHELLHVAFVAFCKQIPFWAVGAHCTAWRQQPRCELDTGDVSCSKHLPFPIRYNNQTKINFSVNLKIKAEVIKAVDLTQV